MKNIKLEINLKGFINDSFKVKSDQRRLQQVFLNILSNAVKFTDRNGNIIVLIETISNENKLRISVTDDGLGIKEED